MILRHKLSLVFSVALSALAAPAVAQIVQPIPGITAPDPVNTLSIHLRTLAANPRNLFALLGAGQAALDVGDPNAALGFFARAEEIDPRSAKAKAGLASALVMLEKPDDALRVFGEAASLGLLETAIAKDRGLAYDLRGDNRRAQRDYMMALKQGPDDEVTRRYALSLGISGDRSQALTVLDPLLRKQDQGAWRARAFILAMNNDVSGANAIARQVMPASLAGTMSPFLSRLARLNPAERAHAVNFGTMPSDGQTFASVQIGDPFRPIGGAPSGGNAGDGLIPAGAPLGRAPVPVTAPIQRDVRPPVAVAAAMPVPVAVAPKPVATPGFTTPPTTPALQPDLRVGTRIAAVDPARLPPELRGEAPRTATLLPRGTVLPPPDNVRMAAPVVLAPAPVVVEPKPAPPVQLAVAPPSQAPTPVPTTSAPPTSATRSPLPAMPVVEADPGIVPSSPRFVGPPSAPEPTASAAFEVAPRATEPAPEPTAIKPVETPPPAPANRLASILSGIEPETESAPIALPTATEIKAAQRAAARKAAVAEEAAAAAQRAKDEKAKEAAAAKANPARLWVQVATGSNARGLGTTWRKIREANDKLLKPYGGYSVAFKSTNRVLAGPVKSSADARALVNALDKAGVSATIYSSEAGQEVVKLGSK
jgi:hypothetical protein